VIGIRPEDLSDAALLGGEENSHQPLVGSVELVEALGSEKLVHFRLEAEHVRGLQAVVAAEDDAEGLEAGEIAAAANVNGVARVEPSSQLRSGEQARFEVATDRLHLFDPASGEALSGPVPRRELIG
jgi:multiple sugar transport system ATP-binding protein